MIRKVVPTERIMTPTERVENFVNGCLNAFYDKMAPRTEEDMPATLEMVGIDRASDVYKMTPGYAQRLAQARESVKVRAEKINLGGVVFNYPHQSQYPEFLIPFFEDRAMTKAEEEAHCAQFMTGKTVIPPELYRNPNANQVVGVALFEHNRNVGTDYVRGLALRNYNARQIP